MGLSVLAWVVIAVVGTMTASAVMANKQKRAMEDAQAGVLIQKQGGTHPIPIVYGERRLAPTKVWEDISKQRLPVSSPATSADSYFTHNNEAGYPSSRDDEDFLHRLDVYCHGPVENISNIEIDNDPVNTHKRFTTVKNNRPLFRALNKHGASSQTMFTELTAGFTEITSAMKGNDIAWAWHSFMYTADKPQYYGDPKLTALVKGMRLWDPRVNPSDPTIKTWSDNPALVLLDYLTASYGKDLDLADIDTTSFITAANECDVVVALPAQEVTTDSRFYYNPVTGEYEYVGAGGYNPNGSTTVSQKRFTCNMVLMPDVDSKENVTEILKTFKGALPFINGQYVLSMEVAANSVMSFDDSNIIDGVSISYGDRSKRLNQVTVKFPNALKGHKEDAVTWPVSTNALYATLLAEDSGEKLTTEAKLSGVTSYSQAEDLAEFMVRDSRNQQAIVFRTQPLAMQLEPNDIITVTTDALNYVAQPYRVREVKLGKDLTVEVVAQEYDPSVYPWYVGDPEPAPEYVGSSLFDEPNAVTGLTLASTSLTNTDGTANSSIIVNWTAITSGTSSVDLIYVGHKLSASSNYMWTTLPSGGENSYTINGVTDGQTYDVAIRYRNMVGNTSPDTTSSIAIGAVSTVVNTLSSDAAQSALDLEEIILEAETQEDTLNEISETLLDLALTTSTTLGKINDAGIVVDPSTGTVVISAVESLRDETSVTSTNLGIRLDAAEGEIVLKASQSFVNDAIAAATLPEATLESLTDLQLQVNNVEIDLNAAEGSLLLKADTTTVDGLQVSYDQTVIDVDALEAEILLKAESIDFDALESRVDTAEITLEAIDAPSIALTVRSVRNIHEEMDLNDVARLADLLLAYNDREAVATDIAVATMSIHAEVNDRREAVATARTELLSLIDSNLASIISVQTTQATETSALASDITTLTATVGDNSATITSNATATVNALGVLQAKQGIALDVNGYITGYEQFNDGTTSGFTISSDSFKVIDPDGGANQAGTQVFSIENNIVSLGTGVELSADRITAGVLDADRITLNGRDITELTNNANYQSDTEVATTVGTAQTAAETYADSAVGALDFTPYLVSSDVTAFITQAEADAAQLAAETYADALTVNMATTASVSAAITADTTVIDGARITTGTINAARISLSGHNTSELTNDSSYATTTDVSDAVTAIDFTPYALDADLSGYVTTVQGAALQSAAEVYADGLVTNFQTAADVTAAIVADTTVIDGARITTGTIAAARISISGLDASDLNNDAFATPADIPSIADLVTSGELTTSEAATQLYADGLVVGLQTAADVSAALAADTTVIDGARITTGTIDAARISISGLNISDLTNDEGYALDTAIPDVSLFQTAANVSAALAADTTVIDGARITTGTIAAGRISISGLNASELTNDAFATPSDIPDVSAFQTAAEVAAALAADTTVIDGARITTGVINADLITAGTIATDRLSLNGSYLTVVGGELTLTSSFTDSTVTQPTEVDDTTGNTDPSVTVTRITGGKVSVGVGWSLSRKAGASNGASSPFPVTVSLKRDGTIIKSWTVTEGLGGFWQDGNVGAGEPFVAFGNLNIAYLDNSGTTGTATYSVSVTTLSTSNFDLETQLTAQAVV